MSEEPTIVERPLASAPAHDRELTGGTAHGTRGSSGTLTFHTGITAAPLILRSEEVARAHALVRLVALVGGSALVAIWLPERISPGRWVATIVVTATILLSLFLSVEFRDAERFTERKMLTHGLACVASILSVVFYVGVYSPAVTALCVGIYFFGLGDSPRSGWMIYLACSFGYLALCVLAISGLIDLSASVMGLAHADVPSQLANALVIQVLLALTFWLGRKSRGATLMAFERLERAALQIKQREALLDEARADMDRVNAVKVGRHSGTRVGDYEVIELIGRGAMGEVYRGRHVPSERPVALKFLGLAAMEEPAQFERFLREAEITSAISSPHIVQTLESGRLPDGSPYLVMELLEGHDLAWHLRAHQRMGMSAVLTLVAEVAQALSAADELGVVHRDLKPQNLFLAEGRDRSRWKVLDFGVSKMGEAASNLTQGAAVGTPSYMSPEQARGEDVDHRADVFALGVVAYRALTGQPPFTASDSISTLYNVAHVQPPRPSGLVRVTEDVERVLALALAKDRSRRFASATMFATALRDGVRHRLDERLRRDADRLLLEQPWGADTLVAKRSA
ncbi:MAG: serine/threonine-protein kinase [Sorangiineae bacterium]|nr:serine/threonine-protein kinase [Polyangiaceae bacterium]MEB2322566.1 serine/threonine-protein kinase [Sorangiineae bacterium]